MKKENTIINVLGDSITKGSAASSPDRCFVSLLKKNFGFKKVNNFGVSGTRIARKRTPSSVAKYDECFLDRVEKMGDADIVIVFGGTNDWGHGDAPIGELNSTDEFTFCGAVNSLIKKLKTKYKDKLIFFITPLHRKNDYNVFGEGAKILPGESLDVYVSYLKRIVSLNGLPVLDVYDYSNYSSQETFFKEIISRDGVHPSDNGHKFLAEKICDFISRNINWEE